MQFQEYFKNIEYHSYNYSVFFTNIIIRFKFKMLFFTLWMKIPINFLEQLQNV